jgi:hypothetical protein
MNTLMALGVTSAPASRTMNPRWMGMQTTYDIEIARDEIGAKIKARVHPRAA